MRVKTKVSIYDGYETHPAGAVVSVDPKQATRLLLRGHAELLDKAGKSIPRDKAVKELRVSADDLKRYTASADAI